MANNNYLHPRYALTSIAGTDGYSLGQNSFPYAWQQQKEYELRQLREHIKQNTAMEAMREQYLRGSWYEGVPSQAPAKKELTCPSCNERHDSGYWGINNSGRCSRMAKKFNDKIRKLYWHRKRKEIE